MSNNSFVPNRALSFLLLLLVSLAAHGTALAQGSAFTYQGRLTDGGNPANGQYDLQFQLFDTATVGTGTQQGSPVIVPNVTVTAGIFTVQLDFGTVVFPGANRFLEIAVKPTGGSTFTTLGPRQPVTSTPYAVRSATSASADTAANATQLGGLAASGFIQNTTTQQGATNFNVSGDGIAGGMLSAFAVNAAAQYNLNGARILGTPGNNNIFVGPNAGAANTTGFRNSFFGNAAGQANTIGSTNSFFGNAAGLANTQGCCNSFFGESAGQANTTGNTNSFFGATAGFANTTGSNNSFFGRFAGRSNTTGGGNSFFGQGAGSNNITGEKNSFFGDSAGFANTSGGFNSFFGLGAGASNTTANSNSFFGSYAGSANTTGFSNSFFGRDAGDFNTTGSSNSFFGNAAGRANTTGFGNSFFGAFAGGSNTTGTQNSFFGDGAGNANTTGGSNSFFGIGAGNVNSTGGFNSFFGGVAGLLNTTGDSNSFFGYGAGRANTGGLSNSFFGRDAGAANTFGYSNVFFGQAAGQANTSGYGNSFFGSEAGSSNTTGNFSSFFGQQAGNNTTGTGNSFFGDFAGLANTTGEHNSFFGRKAGDSNTIGMNNTMIGTLADVGSNNLTNATAIGFEAMVSQSNSMVLGSINGVNNATADTNVGIGTTAPARPLEIATGKLRFSSDLGDIEFTEVADVIAHATEANPLPGDPAFRVDVGTNLTRVFTVLNNGNVGIGAATPAVRLHVAGGTVRVDTLGGAGATALCRNASNQISTCSSSLRYKDHLAPFTSGLELIDRLRPITFNWKQSGERDLGLAAEDVAQVEPLLVTHNDNGEVEGVKYDRITVLLLNAIKQQQRLIKQLQEQITTQQDVVKLQQTDIAALKKIVCRDHPDAGVCNY